MIYFMYHQTKKMLPIKLICCFGLRDKWRDKKCKEKRLKDKKNVKPNHTENMKETQNCDITNSVLLLN